MSLLSETKALLKKHRKDMTTKEISERSGVGIQWLMKFGQGKIPNPGVENVQRLHDYLAKRDHAKKYLSSPPKNQLAG